MSHKVDDGQGGFIERDTVLQILESRRIVSVKKVGDDLFEVLECCDLCDGHFAVLLSADQVRALAAELIALVDTPAAEEDKPHVPNQDDASSAGCPYCGGARLIACPSCEIAELTALVDTPATEEDKP